MKMVQSGIESESSDRLDARLLDDMPTMGADGMDRDVEFVGDKFAAKALSKKDKDLRLALREETVVVGDKETVLDESMFFEILGEL